MSKVPYNLRRNTHACARLNLQDWIMSYNNHGLVHHSVHLGPSAAVADVGTGTGAWLFKLAQQLPKSTVLDAIDIDLSQLPHEKWLPENVRGIKLDVHEPLPPELQNKYDLVHVRLFVLVVQNQDPKPLIENLMKMAKKGGYIQWTEHDVFQTRIAKASDDIKSTATEKLQNLMMQTVRPRLGSPPGWVAQLPQMFESCGLTNVTVKNNPIAAESGPTAHDTVLMGLEEMADYAPDGGELRSILNEAAVEFSDSRRGLAIMPHSMTVVGRVPE